MKPELTQGQRLRLEEGGGTEIIPKYTLAYIDATKKCSKSNFRPEMLLIRACSILVTVTNLRRKLCDS